MDAIKKAACERHNILVVGQPGTGKSTLLLSLAQSAKQKGLSVHITASTGIASASLGGVTIHKYTGEKYFLLFHCVYSQILRVCLGCFTASVI